MSVSSKHILSQGPMLRALGETAVAALWPRRGEAPAAPFVAPGPESTVVLPPRPAALVADYVRHVGGDPSAYRKVLPPHMAPQWGFAPAARTLRGVQYPMHKAVNYGCRLEIRDVLPANAPLTVTARLDHIDDDGRRAILRQRVVTSAPGHEAALVAYFYAYVPLGAPRQGGERKSSPKGRVPDAARELAFWRLRADAGLEFAKLTGDFNPIHWVPAYAKAFGFRSTILHGFATMARAMEGLTRNLFAGGVDALAEFDARFTRPLVLPARVGLYLAEGDKLSVGDAPGGPAYLEGSFVRRGGAVPSA